jgi:hypothetical protein
MAKEGAWKISGGRIGCGVLCSQIMKKTKRITEVIRRAIS